MNDLDRLESDVFELESKVTDLQYRVGYPPYYLVGITGRQRTYIGVFYCFKAVTDFINSCRLKSVRGSVHGFKKRSPLGNVDKYEIARFYIPEHIPIEPTFGD
jgi:hypothetical protein